MLRKFNGTLFSSRFDSEVVSFYRSRTDKRFVLDVVAPGFSQDDVVVQLNPEGDKIKVIVDPTSRPPLDADGDPDMFGYNRVKTAFGKQEFVFDLPDGYDVGSMAVSSHVGLFRIQFNKTEQPWVEAPITVGTLW